MANINETLRFLSESGLMRQRERLRRTAPETLINIASALENLRGARQTREFAAEAQPFTQRVLETQVEVGEEAFDFDQATKKLRREMPGVVEQYGSYQQGDRSIKDVGLTPNPLTRTVQALIESGQTDIARRAEPEVFKQLTRGEPESVRAAQARSRGIGKNLQTELAITRERHNLRVMENALKQTGELKEIEFRTLSNINEFMFKISQGEVQTPLLLESIKAAEKLVDDYGSKYKVYVEGLRKDYESYKAGEITPEELSKRVGEKYIGMKEELIGSAKESQVNIKTGEPKEKPEEEPGKFDLSDEQMQKLPTITAGGVTWRQVIKNGVSYIYAPNSKKPAFQVVATKWGSLTDEQKAKVLKSKGL
jgi:hypothetical protein